MAFRLLTKRKGRNTISSLFFRLGSGKPGIKISKNSLRPREGTNLLRLIILDSMFNLPDLTESNNCLQVMQYVF